MLHRPQRKPNQMQRWNERKKIQLFLHTLCCCLCVCFRLCYVSNGHDDDMDVSTKERQKCINRFLFRFYFSSFFSIRIFTRRWLKTSLFVNFFLFHSWFQIAHTKELIKSIRWFRYPLKYICMYFFFSSLLCVSNELKFVPEFYLFFPLASSEFNSPNFNWNCIWRMNEWNTHTHTFDTAGYIWLYCQHIQPNSIKMAQVFAPIYSIPSKWYNGFSFSSSTFHLITALQLYNTIQLMFRRVWARIQFTKLNLSYKIFFFWTFWHNNNNNKTYQRIQSTVFGEINCAWATIRSTYDNHVKWTEHCHNERLPTRRNVNISHFVAVNYIILCESWMGDTGNTCFFIHWTGVFLVNTTNKKCYNNSIDALKFYIFQSRFLFLKKNKKFILECVSKKQWKCVVESSMTFPENLLFHSQIEWIIWLFWLHFNGKMVAIKRAFFPS